MRSNCVINKNKGQCWSGNSRNTPQDFGRGLEWPRWKSQHFTHSKARVNSSLIPNDQHCPLVLLITQLDHMMEGLFKNLFPGANYQRLITCLELLNVFDACFFNFEANKGLNKGSANSDPTSLIEYVNENFQLLNMYKRKQHCEAFLSCILYYMEDVRSNAFQLLKNFDSDHAVAMPHFY